MTASCSRQSPRRDHVRSGAHPVPKSRESVGTVGSATREDSRLFIPTISPVPRLPGSIPAASTVASNSNCRPAAGGVRDFVGRGAVRVPAAGTRPSSELVAGPRDAMRASGSREEGVRPARTMCDRDPRAVVWCGRRSETEPTVARGDRRPPIHSPQRSGGGSAQQWLPVAIRRSTSKSRSRRRPSRPNHRPPHHAHGDAAMTEVKHANCDRPDLPIVGAQWHPSLIAGAGTSPLAGQMAGSSPSPPGSPSR